MEQLEALQGCATVGVVPHQLREVGTSLKFREWERRLGDHPDQRFARYLLHGILGGGGGGGGGVPHRLPAWVSAEVGQAEHALCRGAS